MENGPSMRFNLQEKPGQADSQFERLVNDITKIASEVMEDKKKLEDSLDAREHQLPPDELEHLIAKRMDEWHQSPAYLASTSPAKIALLEKADIFHDVISVSPRHDREKEDHRRFMAELSHPIFNLKTESTMRVALGKLIDSLKENDIPENAFLIAADTMPQFFPRTDSAGAEQRPKTEAISLERPQSMDEARETLLYVFQSIVRGYTYFLYHTNRFKGALERGGHTPIDFDYLMTTFRYAMLDISVSINTGLAIKFPYEEFVTYATKSVQMHPEAIFKFVEHEAGHVTDYPQTQFIEEIVEKLTPTIKDIIEKIIGIQGDRTLQVSGGIDYTNQEVRSVLGARFTESYKAVPNEEVDEEVFQGMPTQTIRRCLKWKVKNPHGKEFYDIAQPV